MSDIIVAGCGIGGLEAALKLERKLDQEITVIEPRNHTIFYPSLHKVLENKPFERVSIDLTKKFNSRDINHIQDKITGLDTEEQTVQLKNSENLQFTKLVLALGSETAYHGVTRNSIPHTLRFKEDVQQIQEQLVNNQIENVVIAGAGATGIESAASLYSASRDYGPFNITLIEAQDQILKQFKPSVREIVEKDYRQKGIHILTDTLVESIEQNSVKLQNGNSLPSDLTIWAGGIKPNPVIDNLGLEQGRIGLKVNNHLQCLNHPDIYAVGDIADYDGKVNRAFYALAEAKTAAQNIVNSLGGKKLQEHSLLWDPNVIYLGPGDAIFEYKGWCWRGWIPAMMRTWGIEKRYLWTRRHML